MLLFWSAMHCSIMGHELTDTLRQSSVTAYSTRNITPVRSLSGSDLERLSSQSVADALRYFSGVQIKDYGGIGGLKTVNVRSLGAQHVGVFIDGIRITNAQNGQVDLGRYSLDNMEAVSLYNAQKSETLQSATEYASGSTVYLKTKVPVFISKPFNVTARIKAGSFSSFSPSVRYEQKIGKVSLSAEGMYLYSKGDYRFRIRNELEDTTGRRTNGDIRAVRGELGLWMKPWGGELQAHAYLYSSERGLPGPVVRRLSDQYSSKDRQWDENMFLQASYRKSFRHSALLLNAKGTYDYLEYFSDPSVNSAAIYAHNHYHQRDLYGSAAYAWYPTEWISTNFAVDERVSDLRCDVKHFNYVKRFDTRVVAAATVLLENLTLQASALYSRISDRTENATDPLQNFSPTVTVGWHNKSNTLSLRSFYKTIFRAPTLNDLYYVLVGNARLKPEYARQMDLGFDLHSPSDWKLQSKLSADMFLNNVTNKIVAMPAQSQFRWTMMNYGKVKGEGVDVSWDNSLKAGKTTLRALLSYSFEIAEDRTDPGSIGYGGQIPYTPWHSGSLILGAVKGPWSASLSFLYTGIRFTSSDNYKASRLDSWRTTDLGISRDFKARGCLLNLGLDVNNIFNQRYEVVTRYPMPGTNIMGKITIKI